MEIFESLHLTKLQFEELANLIVDKTFRRREKIFYSGRLKNVALYLLREGTVKLTGRRSDVIKPGAYFGEDLLCLDPQQASSVKGLNLPSSRASS